MLITLLSCTTIHKTIYEYHHNNDRGVLRGLRYSFTDIDASEEEETTFLMCKGTVKNMPK